MDENYRIPSEEEKAVFEKALKHEIFDMINDYTRQAMFIKADTPLGKIARWFGGLFRKASRGPDYYKPFLDDGWQRPINIAGSGCIIVGLFLLLGIIAFLVFLAKKPLWAIVCAIVFACIVAYSIYMRKKEKERLLELDNKTLMNYNRNETDEASKRIDALRDGTGELAAFANSARYLYGTSFTAFVVDYRNNYHYFIGDAAMLTDGTNFKKIYCLVMPTHERLDEGALDKYRKIFEEKYNVRSLYSKACNSTKLPAGGTDLTLSWYLPK